MWVMFVSKSMLSMQEITICKIIKFRFMIMIIRTTRFHFKVSSKSDFGLFELTYNIRSITSNHLPPPDHFFQKNQGRGVVGEIFLLAQNFFAYGELEINPTKSAPAAGI